MSTIEMIAELEHRRDMLEDEADTITIQLAENLSWIAKAENARRIKLRQVMRLQERLAFEKKNYNRNPPKNES